jgi:outer membrane protein
MDRPIHYTQLRRDSWHGGGVLLVGLLLLLPLAGHAGEAVEIAAAPPVQSGASGASQEIQLLMPAQTSPPEQASSLVAPDPAPNQSAVAAAPLLLLPEAVERAIAHSPGLSALEWQAWAQWEQALSVEGRGGLFSELTLLGMQTNSPLGVFAARLSQGRVTQADFDPARLNDPDYLGNIEYKLKLTYPLFTSRRIELIADALRLNGEAIDLDRLDAEHELTARVIELYFAHDLLERQLLVLDDAQQTTEALLRLITSLEAEGLVLQADIAAAEVEAANIASEINTAQQNLALTENVMALLTGAAAGGFSTRIDVNPEQIAVPSLNEATAAALDNRPDLQALSRRVCAATKMLDEAIRQRNPTLGAFAELKHSSPGLPGDGHSDATVGAQLTLDLDTGGVLRHTVEQKRAELQAAQLGLAQLEQTAQIEVAQAYSALLTAQGALQLFAAQSEKSAENLRVVRNRYREGLTNYLDLRMAVTTHKDSQLRELNARYGFLLADVRLLSATGQLGRDNDPFLAPDSAGAAEEAAAEVKAAGQGAGDAH